MPSTDLSTLTDDEAVSKFMETHDGFELADQGLAEIEASSSVFTRGKSYIEVDTETFRLLDNLVAFGACSDMRHTLNQAVHSYMRVVQPQSQHILHQH